jgi:thiosulfate/3-mercaptopyruvate sulfurtransferase
MLPPIVELDFVLGKLPGAVWCDVRYSLDGSEGYQDYLRVHIPGARYVSVDHVLAASPGPIVGRHPLPTPKAFSDSLGQLGIAHSDTVVAYDSVGGRFAARLVWMLRIIGQSAALLDGGLQAWSDHRPDEPLESGLPTWNTVQRNAIEWPEQELVSSEQVAEVIRSGGLVIDSRAPERYRGDVEPIDPKAGHIPGAINVFFGDNYVDGGNYFKSADQLAARFNAAGFDQNTICYCGSGVTTCNNVLAAEAAGLPRPKVYVGSWSGWATQDLPVAVGNDNP